MRTENREVKSYEKVYISVDGKEFKKEEDCRNWEESYKGTLSKSINSLNVCLDYNAIDLYIPYGSEEDEVWVVKLEDLDQVVLMNAYIKAETNQSVQITADKIGKTLVLNWGYDKSYCDVYDLEQAVLDVTNNLNGIINSCNKKFAEKGIDKA